MTKTRDSTLAFAFYAVVFVGGSAVAGPPLGTVVWTVEGGAPDTMFGGAVGSAGDVNGDGYADFLVGAQSFDGDLFGEGRAACYYGGPNGLGSVPDWMAEGDVENGEFGFAVATAGDVNGDGYSDVLIGARRMGDNKPGEGFIFIYLGSATGLSFAPSQFFDSNENAAFLGCSVAAAGDIDADGFCDIVAGARLMDYEATDGGAAFVYPGFAGGVLPPNWSKGHPQPAALFGYSVSGAGDVNADGFADIVVGAYEANDGLPSEGLVFGFYGSASGLPLTASWVGDVDQVSSHLGYSVKTAGDVNGDGYSDVIAGAPDHGTALPRQGAAYLFVGGGNGLETTPRWSALGRAAETAFGHAVSTAGDVNGDGFADVVVGSPRFDVTLASEEGCVEVFLGSPTGVSATAEFTYDGLVAGGQLGYYVAAAGDVNGDGRCEFSAGAPFTMVPEYDEGIAVVFAGAAPGLAAAPALQITGAHPTEGFASSLAFLGDVDGDGFFDLAAGSSSFDPGAIANAGRVVVFRGITAGLATTPDWTHFGATSGAREGRRVVGPGDVDGDGHSDLLVAGAATNGVGFFRGRLASEGLFGTAPDAVYLPDPTTLEIGGRAAAIGDVNADGFTDVALRAKRSSDGGFDVRVHLGGAGGLAQIPSHTISMPTTGGEIEVAGGGDFDADGRDDLLVSDPLGGGGNGELRMLRSTSGASEVGFTSMGTVFGTTPGERFGAAIALARDLDSDGDSEIAVGAPDAAGSFVGAGRVDVFHGSSSGPSLTPNSSILGVAANAGFGAVVASAGDVDGDGCCDLLVSSLRLLVTPGRVDLFVGSELGLQTTPAFSTLGSAPGDSFGYAIVGGFDANADGFADVAISATGVDTAGVDSGALSLFVGGGGLGRSAAPRLTRADSALPVAPGGFVTTSNVGFELATNTAFGRGFVRVEWEAAPAGQPFATSPWTKRGVGPWVDSSSQAKIGVSSTALAAGEAHVRYRLRYDPVTLPFSTHGPWFGAPFASRKEATLRVAPSPAILAVALSNPLVVLAPTNGAVASQSVELKNLGGAPLSWAAYEVEDAGWLDLHPSAGAGLLSSEGATSLTLTCDPTALDPGEYVSVLRFVDLAQPDVFLDHTITFQVTSVAFVVGDRIEAYLGPLGDHAFGEFDAVAGMKLKLALVEGTAFGSKYGISLEDAKGVSIAHKTVTSGKPKASFTIPASGKFRLRLERLGGPPAKLALSTKRLLPDAAESFEKTLKKNSSSQKSIGFVAFASTVGDFEFAPNAAFVGPLTVVLVRPGAPDLDLAELGTPFGSAGFLVPGLELESGGAYELRFMDFAGEKIEKVKVVANLDPPPPGTGVVILKTDDSP